MSLLGVAPRVPHVVARALETFLGFGFRLRARLGRRGRHGDQDHQWVVAVWLRRQAMRARLQGGGYGLHMLSWEVSWELSKRGSICQAYSFLRTVDLQHPPGLGHHAREVANLCPFLVRRRPVCFLAFDI